MQEWVTIASNLGVAGTVILAVGVSVSKISKWIAPRIDKVIDHHCAFVVSMGQQMEQQTFLLREMNITQQELLELLDVHNSSHHPDKSQA